MLAPISWLKEYVDIKLPVKDLMWKMTEAGLTCESFQKVGKEIILDVEVTPNRPDWLSIVGIAREIAAIQNTNLKLPEIKDIEQNKKSLPVKINNNFDLCSRYCGVAIASVKIGQSPKWLQERLKAIGLRPINNLVDVTNYVMFEFGNPIHVFDYDKFDPHEISICLSKGGEKFTSVDEKNYVLPKNAIVYKNKNRVVDLCGIKGGLNSGISQSTKNILIHVAIYNGVFIRRTSQSLKLSSEASYIFERGANAGGTLDALKRTANLIQKLAGGQIASHVIDVKKKNQSLQRLSLSLTNLKKILGITIPDKAVIEILSRLSLSPHKKAENIICTIPTYRGDLKIEEDLIEEVARIWGYNAFPKTLPGGALNSKKIPYFYDRKFEMKLKNILFSCGFNETLTLSLISADLIDQSLLSQKDHVRIANPVSLEYEFLRTSLIPSLLLGIKLNTNEKNIKLFEYNKIYDGQLGMISELYKLSAVQKGGEFSSLRGTVDLLFNRLNIDLPDTEDKRSNFWHPKKSGTLVWNGIKVGVIGEIHPQVLANFYIKDRVFAFELDASSFEKLPRNRIFVEIPKYPPQLEDITLVMPKGVTFTEVVRAIRKMSEDIRELELIDLYENSFTIRIRYQSTNRTLTDEDVEKIRSDFLKTLRERFAVTSKS